MICYNCSSKKLKYDKELDAYRCQNCGHLYPKEYWFISHSHLDIEKVRIIRDVIEEVFFYEPILFFLKCLSDEDEINNLIRREIEQRIWFVYCDSQNARNSRYVQEERAYLKRLVDGGKKINELAINLDEFELWHPKCKKYIRDKIFRGIRKTKLFLLCERGQAEVVYPLYERLLADEYTVFYLPVSKIAVSDFGFATQQKMKEHSYEDGAILAFISPQTLENELYLEELRQAQEQKATVIPVFLCGNGQDENERRERLIDLFPALEKANYSVYDLSDPSDAYKRLLQTLKYFYIT